MKVNIRLKSQTAFRLRYALGATGLQGQQGEVGPAGPPNTLAIGTVTTLPYGSPATANVTGTAPNQTLDLGLPMGAQGPSGSVTDGDKGDVVVSGGGTTWTLDPSVQAANDARYHSILSGLGLNNRLINGGFRISQRGTTFNASGYTLDRWNIQFGSGGAGTVTRNPIVGDDLGTSLLWSQTVGATIPYLSQAIEDARSLAGKRVCVSFGAALISGTTTLTPRLVQVFGTGGSPSTSAVTVGTPITLTGSRVSQFLTLPSVFGKTFGTNGDSYLRFDLVADTGATFSVSLTDVQVEEAPAVATGPTPFERIPLELDLALCYRYFQALPTPFEVPYGAASPAVMQASKLLPVRMRAAPAVTVSVAPTLANCTSFSVTANADQFIYSVAITGAAGQYGITGSGVLYFSAEL